MKSQSQITAIAVITLITMALSLSVAMLCIARLKDATHPSDTVTLNTEPPNTEPPDLPSGQAPDPCLEFVSNGNGSCTLTGLGSYVGDCVVIPERSPAGERVSAVASMAFFGTDSITAVEIPASVAKIGDMAFSACPNLVSISVSPQSPFFCDLDGVLFSSDLSTLLVYPAKHPGSELVLPLATVRIADMAFYGCAYLTFVRYEGSAADWERIRIGIKNYSLTAAAKEFLGSAEGPW